MNTPFLFAAKRAGIDGLLLVDCPPEETHLIDKPCKDYDIPLIYVIAPSTPLSRIRHIDQCGQGFLYYACRRGTTGLRDVLPDDFSQKLHSIKSIVHLPVVVGFGISNQAMVNQVLAQADGVVIGSLFVQALADGMSTANLTALARTILPNHKQEF